MGVTRQYLTSDPLVKFQVLLRHRDDYLMNIFTVMEKIITGHLTLLISTQHFMKISVNTSKQFIGNRQKNFFTFKETVIIKSVSFKGNRSRY